MLRTAAAAAVLLAWTSAPAAQQADAAPLGRPNILLFLVDDLGWKDGGVLGSRFHETPRLDRMATEGMRFTQAYSNGPNCAPSRASLMTGLYTPRHRILTVGRSTRGRKERRKLVPIENTTTLDPATTTVAEVLRDAGYATGVFGKWHLNRDPRVHGFDVAVAANQAGSPRGGHFSPYRNPDLEDGPEDESLTDRLTAEAARFVREHTAEGRPWFTFLTHYAVHTPIQAEPDRAARFAAKLEERGDGLGPGPHDPEYAAMVERVDRSLGRMLDLLDELDQGENTVVVYLSDNGGYGPATSMAPLRGAKGMLFEGGIRIPLLVRWPGTVPAGRENATPVLAHDLFPTLIRLAGARAPENDGVDLGALWTGAAETLPERSLYWHFPCYLQRYRGMARPFRTRPAGAIRSGDLKLLEWFEEDPDAPARLSLYDLASDPGETRDLAAERPGDAARLRAALEEWRTSVGARVPTEPNPHYDAEADADARRR